MAESRTIGVFGAGWVGLVTGGCFAELGHEVIVRDVMPERIEALHAELISKKYKYLRPGIEIAPWKAKCMEVIDPFGNRIRFNEDLKPGKAT